MAIPLASKLNVEAPSGAFPYGNIKDNPGDNTGTAVNKAVYADFHQFFAKMFAESGLVYNNLPDNATNTFQYWEALKKLFGGSSSTTIPTILTTNPGATLSITSFEVVKRGNLVSYYIGGGITIDNVGGLNTGSGFVTWKISLPAIYLPLRSTIGGGIAFASQSSAPYKPGQVYAEKDGLDVLFRFNAIENVVVGEVFVFALTATYECAL
jgi:hypothetical protein